MQSNLVLGKQRCFVLKVNHELLLTSSADCLLLTKILMRLYLVLTKKTIELIRLFILSADFFYICVLISTSKKMGSKAH